MRERPRHVRLPVPVTLGYRITRGVLDALFAIAVAGMSVFLLGPVAYGMGL